MKLVTMPHNSSSDSAVFWNLYGASMRKSTNRPEIHQSDIDGSVIDVHTDKIAQIRVTP